MAGFSEAELIEIEGRAEPLANNPGVTGIDGRPLYPAVPSDAVVSTAQVSREAAEWILAELQGGVA